MFRRSLNSSINFFLAYCLAFAPVMSVLPLNAHAGTNSENDSSQPIVYQDITEVVQNGQVIQIENIIVEAEDGEQFEVANKWFASEVNKADEAGLPYEVVSSSHDSSARAENVLAEIHSELPTQAKKKHFLLRARDSFKSSLEKVFTPFIGAFGRFNHNHPTKFRHLFGVTRGMMNAVVMSAVFHSHYIEGVTIGEKAFSIPGLGLDVPSGGAGLLAGVLAGTLSYIMTAWAYPKGHPKEGETVFYSWLTTPGKFSSSVLTKMLKKFLPNLSDEAIRNIVIEVTGVGKWTTTEFIFLGVPVITLLIAGFPMAPTLSAALVAFILSTMSGVTAQYNLDAYLGKFQQLFSLESEAGSHKRSLGVLMLYLQMLAISVVSTGVTTLTLGAEKWVGYTAVGVLFAAGVVLNKKITKRLSDAYNAFMATKACANLLKKGA